MEIKKIGIIGCGFMGKGIMHVLAEHNFKIIMIARKTGDMKIFDYLQKELDKKHITEEVYKKIKSNIRITTNLKDISSCQLVIECINENQKDKQKLLEVIDQVCDSETIFASNTSSISIESLANSTKRKSKVVGLHFISPVPRMQLVEIVQGIETSEQTVITMEKLVKNLEKIPIVIKDYPGFVSSRLTAVLINEAANILMQGVASVEAIDNVAKLGMNLPIGPLKLADEVGLDVVQNVMDSIYQSYKDNKYILCPMIENLVNSNCLGRKTGKGFYTYTK